MAIPAHGLPEFVLAQPKGQRLFALRENIWSMPAPSIRNWPIRTGGPCNVYMRYGDLDAAIETGRRAVKLLPDLVQVHYFLGLAYFLSCEAGAHNYEVAVPPPAGSN